MQFDNAALQTFVPASPWQCRTSFLNYQWSLMALQVGTVLTVVVYIQLRIVGALSTQAVKAAFQL